MSSTAAVGFGDDTAPEYRKFNQKKTVSLLNYGQLTGLTNSGSGYTYAVAMAIQGPFKKVRFLVANIATGGTITYGPFSASVAASVTDTATARNNSATQVPILFGGQATVTIAAASATDTPVCVWSDYADITNSTVTAEGYYWICGRVYSPTTNTQQLTTSANRGAGWNTQTTGRKFWSTGSGSGDFVTSNVTGYAGGLNTGQNVIIGVEVVLSSGDVHQVSAWGDSVFAGAGTGVTLVGDSFLFRGSVNVSTTTYPTWLANYSWPGKTTAYALTRFLAEIDLTASSSAVFWGYSTNDGSPTQALLDAALGRCQQFIRECRYRGIVPIIATPLLNTAWTTNEKTLLRSHRQKIRALDGAAVIMDLAAVLLEADELSFIAGATDDGVHLNTAVGIPAATVASTTAIKNAVVFKI